MDPISVVVSALIAGADASAKDTTSQSIKDAYDCLRSLLLRKFASRPKALATLIDYEEDPDAYEKPFREVLSEAKVEQNAEIMEIARKLYTMVQPQQMGMGKYNIQNTGKVEGQVIGEHNQITQHFRNLSLLS